MWTSESLHAPPRALATNAFSLTTTRSTAVRVSWLLAGFFVGVGDAIHEKAETTVAPTSLRRYRESRSI